MGLDPPPNSYSLPAPAPSRTRLSLDQVLLPSLEGRGGCRTQVECAATSSSENSLGPRGLLLPSRDQGQAAPRLSLRSQDPSLSSSLDYRLTLPVTHLWRNFVHIPGQNLILSTFWLKSMEEGSRWTRQYQPSSLIRSWQPNLLLPFRQWADHWPWLWQVSELLSQWPPLWTCFWLLVAFRIKVSPLSLSSKAFPLTIQPLDLFPKPLTPQLHIHLSHVPTVHSIQPPASLPPSFPPSNSSHTWRPGSSPPLATHLP